MTRPHALYRFRDPDGVLLYVGITHDPGQRWPAHMRHKPWWTEVATIELEQHPDRTSALTAERDAIHDERPLYNVIHNGGRPVEDREHPCPPMLTPGQIIAAAVTGRRLPPIGVVTRSDHRQAWLTPYQPAAHRFAGDQVHVEYRRLLCHRPAVAPDYDMRPLLAFQAEWTRPFKQLTTADRRQVERSLATPGHYGPML